MPGQNYFRQGQNQNCPRQNIFHLGQKILSKDKSFMIACQLFGKSLFTFEQNIWSCTKNFCLRQFSFCPGQK